MEWLDESERNLDSEVEIANEPDKIKTQLTQHKVIKTLFPQYHVPLVCLSTLYSFIRCKIFHLRVQFGRFDHEVFFHYINLKLCLDLFFFLF